MCTQRPAIGGHTHALSGVRCSLHGRDQVQMVVVRKRKQVTVDQGFNLSAEFAEAMCDKDFCQVFPDRGTRATCCEN